jgi:hypothetical protein
MPSGVDGQAVHSWGESLWYHDLQAVYYPKGDLESSGMNVAGLRTPVWRLGCAFHVPADGKDHA